MNILVTGSNGFIGKNLLAASTGMANNSHLWMSCTRDTTEEQLAEYCRQTDFIFHLAGINRPKEELEYAGNFEMTERLVRQLSKRSRPCPIVFASSVHAQSDTTYGKSKRMAEEILLRYGEQTQSSVYLYRLPNVFGKWCRPNYNSVVATFCHQISRDLPISIHEPHRMLTLCYIDDVIEEFFRALQGRPTRSGTQCVVPVTHTVTLQELAELLRQFHAYPQTLQMPWMPDGSLTKKLYATYLTYLPREKTSFSMNMHCDARGSFTELVRTGGCGQFSVNISRPGITKGQHWHQTKWELFMVVSGHGLIQQRKIGCTEVLEYEVSGDRLEAVYMIPGYTHNIKNLSDSDPMVTLMWANESFDPARPDTFYEEV